LVLNAEWERLTSRKRGIVLAADVDTLDALKRLTDAAADTQDVVAIKVGVTLALRHGLAAVAKAVTANSGLAVVYDHQKAGTDIPAMGRPFARACCDAGVHAVIFFPLAGPRTLEAFVTGAQEQGLIALVGLVMTHQEYLASEGGYILDSAPEAICSRALALKVLDFVLPGTKPQLIAKFTNTLLAGTGARIFMPGVGSQGGTVASAVGAASPLAAFPIIGSAVYAAPNPSAALSSFAAELTL
jgi:orotidine-5'-phosphate decarboxylase